MILQQIEMLSSAISYIDGCPILYAFNVLPYCPRIMQIMMMIAVVHFGYSLHY